MFVSRATIIFRNNNNNKLNSYRKYIFLNIRKYRQKYYNKVKFMIVNVFVISFNICQDFTVWTMRRHTTPMHIYQPWTNGRELQTKTETLYLFRCDSNRQSLHNKWFQSISIKSLLLSDSVKQVLSETN